MLSPRQIQSTDLPFLAEQQSSSPIFERRSTIEPTAVEPVKQQEQEKPVVTAE